MNNSFKGIALHTWTLDTTPFPDALAAAKGAGFDAVEIRRVDFTRMHEKGMTNDAVIRMIRDNGLPVSATGVEYGWLFAKGEDSKRLFSVFRETCENAVALDCKLLMSAIGPGEGTVDDAVANVRTAGEIAAEFGLRLTIEYQFKHDVVSTLDVLRDIIARAGHRNVGLLLDTYHLERGGRRGRGFADVPPDEIFYFQYSDVPDAPVQSLPPVDRLAPGQGVIPWTDVLQQLAEKNYSGYLSFEGPNPARWALPPQEAAREAAEATRRVLAQAFPGK